MAALRTGQINAGYFRNLCLGYGGLHFEKGFRWLAEQEAHPFIQKPSELHDFVHHDPVFEHFSGQAPVGGLISAAPGLQFQPGLEQVSFGIIPPSFNVKTALPDHPLHGLRRRHQIVCHGRAGPAVHRIDFGRREKMTVSESIDEHHSIAYISYVPYLCMPVKGNGQIQRSLRIRIQ